jgi:arsenate reductase (thioredoxin)
MRKKILVSTGDSTRSQMAHGYLEYLAGNQLDVYSAGIEAKGLDPRAVAAMREDGIDISHHTSNTADDYKNVAFDFILTVCDNAREKCPFVPSMVRTFHFNFPNRQNAMGTEEEIMQSLRSVREMIKRLHRRLCKELHQRFELDFVRLNHWAIIR